ncbi:hypothetical protein REPUB_Repub03eG0182800 [Reevesia pubescens]
MRRMINDPSTIFPSQTIQESALMGASSTNPLDILVVGGGAIGCGVALDAATRGLRVGLVEQEDFSSGTFSRSTKLIHGGVRYLEKAVFNLDYGQLKLVFHVLEERKQVIDNAPHLCHALPCMTPCFDWFEVVCYWMGLKMYDLVAGHLLHLSRYYSAQESVELFPTLARKGKDKSLKGTVVYYDGQKLYPFVKMKTLNGLLVQEFRDNLSGLEFDTYAKVVVNAAEPSCDSLRKMADKDAQPMICPSSGAHIVLPDYYSPEGMGLIVPKTKDGRVVFMLPWLGRTVRSTDVLSGWSGIRPLAVDPNAKNTESISRDHVVSEDYPGLVTITGGKWTTYRSSSSRAEFIWTTLELKIKRKFKFSVWQKMQLMQLSSKLNPSNECITSNLRLIGGDGLEPSFFTILAQQSVRMKKSYGGKVVPGVMDTAAAKHLSHACGTLAERVATIAQNETPGKRLAHGYPYLEA